MRFSSKLFQFPTHRNSLSTLFLFAISAVFTYEACIAILDGQAVNLVYLGFILIGAIGVVVILKDWRKGLYAFLAWLLVEDFARKFLGNNMAIYFAKDIFVALVYLSFFSAWRRERFTVFRPPYLVPLLLFVWLSILQVFNPASPHVVFGLLGLKLFLYYIPLMLAGYALVDSEIQLRRFLFGSCVAALVVAGLGIAQSIIGPSFLNPTRLQEDIRALSTLYREAPISGAIVYRPNAVFVSGGRYVDFLLLEWILVLGFTGYLLLRHRRGRQLAFAAIAVVGGAIVMASSRGVFLWSLASMLMASAAFLWGAPWRQREALRIVRALQRTLLGVGLGLILLMVADPNALLGRFAVYSETLSPDSPASELVYRVKDYPIRNFLGAFDYPRWPYGYGIGTTSLGTQYVARIFQVRPPVTGVESGFGTLIVETGILGLVLWILMTVSILVSGWRLVKKLKGSPWFPIGFVIWWYAFLLLLPITFVGMQPYQDFILNAYLWLMLGILFRLPNLALSAQFAAEAAPARPQRRWIA